MNEHLTENQRFILFFPAFSCPFFREGLTSGSLSGCVGFFGHRLFLVLQLFMGFLLDDQPR